MMSIFCVLFPCVGFIQIRYQHDGLIERLHQAGFDQLQISCVFPTLPNESSLSSLMEHDLAFAARSSPHFSALSK